MPEQCSCLPARHLSRQWDPINGILVCSEDFSNFQKLARVTAYVLRAVNRFKAKKSSHSSTLTPQEITAAELSQAQKKLVIHNTLKNTTGLVSWWQGLVEMRQKAPIQPSIQFCCPETTNSLHLWYEMLTCVSVTTESRRLSLRSGVNSGLWSSPSTSTQLNTPGKVSGVWRHAPPWCN